MDVLCRQSYGEVSVLDYQQVATGKVRHLGVGSGANLVACDDRPAAVSRHRPQGELLALAARERLRAGWVLTCVGSQSQAGCGSPAARSTPPGRAPFEVVALTGTLSRDGGHCTWVPDHQGRTVGGHLAEGCTVRTTAEVVVAADDRLLFAREHDPATGYDKLVVRTRDP